MKLTVLVLAAVATVAFAGGGSKKNDDALCAACRDVYMPCKHKCDTSDRTVLCETYCELEVCDLKPKGFDKPCHPTCIYPKCKNRPNHDEP
ncbi:hypothetical protein AA0116_g12427 [Alternaria tenuissima]|nr:hypothetical protein AA0116_g12427 [Alternaria tenuissima]